MADDTNELMLRLIADAPRVLALAAQMDRERYELALLLGTCPECLVALEYPTTDGIRPWCPKCLEPADRLFLL